MPEKIALLEGQILASRPWRGGSLQEMQPITRSLMKMVRSLILRRVGAPEEILHCSEKPRQERTDRQKKTVAKLKHGHRSR